jgi:hypothetical protein
MQPVGDITVEGVGMERHEFAPGSDPRQRGTDLSRMLMAGRVIVGQHDNTGAAQGRTVARAPFARAHGIAGGSQPESLQGLGVFFALHHIDGLATLDRCQRLRQVIEGGLHPLQVPDPPSRVLRVWPPLPEGFRD